MANQGAKAGRLFSLMVFLCDRHPPIVLSSVLDTSYFGWLRRGSAKEFMFFASRELIERTDPGKRQTINHELKEPIDGLSKFVVHVHSNPMNNIGCVVITDSDYNHRAAYGLILKATEIVEKDFGLQLASLGKQAGDQNWSSPNLNDIFRKYTSPQEVDQMMKIQKDLDETREIMIQNIDKLLANGENLEALMEKSQDLSFKTKAFLKQTKELNRCCTII
mmetsp:Transcript_13604/g.18824  ORF Transcript_13604/g.18824 Transcript_13604/m.18824 type:complete len:220 (+) Transcript_13604:60-719(+)